jgi:PQQ-dependent catabolism-associated CXXCW motif protein
MREQWICQNFMPSKPEIPRTAALQRLALGLMLVVGAVTTSGIASAQSWADEDRDWGIAASAQLRQPPYSAPTPLDIPGARTLSTQALKDMLESAATTTTPATMPVLIDVASGDGHRTLPEAYWIPGAGRGANFIDEIQSTLIALLDRLTQGDKQRALVFFCVNTQCWLSYNAALRAVAAGYGRVLWYRGGLEAWRSAGLPLVEMGPSKVQ